jgi:hypothetical protein
MSEQAFSAMLLREEETREKTRENLAAVCWWM